MQEYFSAGELSALFSINVQTLHYYDAIGLLSPSVRDVHTGRRLYKYDQVYKLTTIRYQQKLGKTLKQIKAYMDATDVSTTLHDLEQQQQIVQRRLEELKQVEKIIQGKSAFIRQKLTEIETIKTDRVEVQLFPERPYIAAEGEEFQFGNDFFYAYPTVVFHEHGRKYFGVFVPESLKEAHSLAEFSYIPAGAYYRGYHLGTYETIYETFDRLRNIAAQNGHTLQERTVSLNIIDQFVEPDCTKYLTEVEIRIMQR
jgi:DNA-binding transcriptional MerR regulator